MKKATYIFLLLITHPFVTIAQADLEVEKDVIMEKTLVIGENSISSNNEIVINDYDSDGSSILKIDDGIRRCVIGINEFSEGITGTTSPHSISFTSGNAVGITINSAGNVGLGTSSPGVAFHVSDPGDVNTPTDLVVLESAASNKPAILFSEGGTDPGMTMGILYNGSGSGASEKIQIIDDASDPIVTWTNNELMGIGTENPREELDVVGNAAISSTPGSLKLINGVTDAELTHDGIDLTMASNTGDVKILADRRVILQSLNGSVNLVAEDDIVFQVDHLTKMNCVQSGNWGLNKINPTARFHIKQNEANLPAIRIENDTDTDNWDWEIGNTFLNLSFNGVLKGSYDTGGNYTNTSDRRLKEEITSLKDGALSSILNLTPSSYFYTRDVNAENRTIGFIAQEVQEYFPPLVKENDNEDSDFLGVHYAGVGVVAVKAIQEQNQEIRKFKADIESSNTNEKELDKLATDLADVEKRINGLK